MCSVYVLPAIWYVPAAAWVRLSLKNDRRKICVGDIILISLLLPVVIIQVPATGVDDEAACCAFDSNEQKKSAAASSLIIFMVLNLACNSLCFQQLALKKVQPKISFLYKCQPS